MKAIMRTRDPAEVETEAGSEVEIEDETDTPRRGTGSHREAAAADRLPSVGDLESPRSKLIYLYLLVGGEATANELRSTLDVTGLSLYPTLDVLCDRGLVERVGEHYRPAA